MHIVPNKLGGNSQWRSDGGHRTDEGANIGAFKGQLEELNIIRKLYIGY